MYQKMALTIYLVLLPEFRRLGLYRHVTACEGPLKQVGKLAFSSLKTNVEMWKQLYFVVFDHFLYVYNGAQLSMCVHVWKTEESLLLFLSTVHFSCSTRTYMCTPCMLGA